ncbi:MAG: hypothetical protein HUJ76_12980, partial [Parasporobacterium sp.]|nr:hypothetical protein [Parasporobacterium sp.]
CSKGKLVRRTELIEGRNGVSKYKVQSPDGLDICSILHIHHFTDCSCFHNTVHRTFVMPADTRCCSQEEAWYDEQDSVLHINNCSDPCGGYLIYMAVMPSRDACELPSILYDDFLSLLSLGAKAAILSITGREWSNVQLGDALEYRYKQELKQRAVDMATHKQRGSIRMNFGAVI